MKRLRNYILEQVAAGGLSRERAAQMLAELVTLPNSPSSASLPHYEIAIIGMSCRFPPYDDLDGFWNRLASGTDLVRSLPEVRRQDINALAELLEKVSPALASRFKRPFLEAAYLDRVDMFDYTAFRIAPEEARILDPQQRMLLEVVLECIENAGYSREMLNGSKVGVYMAYTESEYEQLIPLDHPSSVHATLPAMLAGRISYIFNWRGPSQVIETACSSSLVAFHNACQALLMGDCETALVGGVELLLFPFAQDYTDFEQIGIRSPDGRTRAFDSAANGTGNGEGVGAVMLKPLAKAIEDRDYIHAIVKGSAVNSDGKSAGVTAPNPEAQCQVITEAWKKAEINPTTISYIEAHGTATRLGDPIEIQGITKAFKQYTDRKAFCAIGSVKTNMGHLNAAAGIAGLIKTVLALKHRQIPPSLHFQSPNPLISFADSPVFVNDVLRPWDVVESPRRAGVSAFGISGTNCHVILEEAPEQQAARKTPHRPSVLTPRRCWLPVEISVQALLGSAYPMLPENRSLSIIPSTEHQSLSKDKLKWLYTLNWIAKPLRFPVTSAHTVAGTWLLLVDELGFGAKLSSKLHRAGSESIMVSPGASFQRRSAREYQVRPTSQADWKQLFEQLTLVDAVKLVGIVHMWTCTEVIPQKTWFEEGIEQQDTGALSLFALFQQVMKMPVCKPFTIWIVSNFVQCVTKDEQTLFPAKASLWGLTTVISQEHYWAQCYCLDVGMLHQKDDEVSELIFNEMLQDLTEHDHTIVYRQGQRFVQQLEHVNLANVADREQPVIKEGGVYLLAGGAGYVGLNIAKYLARRARVVLVLINRTPLPERDK
jgi:3-oxoacyl-(acyl-carrier-protein) synthase